MSGLVKKNGGVEPPVSLGGLFGTESDEEGEEGGHESNSFVNRGEIQTLMLGDFPLQIRQFSWHQANANQVWPGTFVLSNFIKEHAD